VSLASLSSDIEELERESSARTGSSRYLLGIAGPPAAGKSLLASALVDELNHRVDSDYARVVPLDGFHLRNSVLDMRGLRPIKGAPETFDAAAYAKKLEELQVQTLSPVSCPAFDREGLEEPTDDGILIPTRTRVIIAEGNYLLLDRAPWGRVRSALSQVWYLDVDIATAESRLLARHRSIGNDEDTVRQRVYGNDLENFRLVESTASRAERIIDPLSAAIMFR
jgi:pantothenate kinase